MKTVPVFEAKNRFSELIAAAERGDEVAITRRGVAVARLVAISLDAQTSETRGSGVKAAFAHLRRIRERIELDGNLKEIAREGLD